MTCNRCQIYEAIANVKAPGHPAELWCRACLIDKARELQAEEDRLIDELLERYSGTAAQLN